MKVVLTKGRYGLGRRIGQVDFRSQHLEETFAREDAAGSDRARSGRENLTRKATAMLLMHAGCAGGKRARRSVETEVKCARSGGGGLRTGMGKAV